MSPRTKTLLAAAGLVILGAAAYFNSLRGPFVFDDKLSIVGNSAIRSLWPLGPILAGPRPVVDLTFAINYALDRLNVPGYHLVNLAIHLLAALTLFGIVRRTLARFAGRFDDTAAAALAFCAALIWMVHPLQTESVTYIIQRAESLMGLFYLLTLYCAIRGFWAKQLPIPNCQFPIRNSSAVPWFAAAVLSCALGMGCKEVMVTAPVALLLYDRAFIAGSFREALRRRWGFYLALAATWLILVRSILAAFSPQTASAGFAVPGITPLAYARSEPAVILHYLRLAFWPSGLCLDYAWPVARTASEILPGAVVAAGLLAATIWALARRSACRAQYAAHSWGFAGAWFFLVLAPTSSILPIRDLAFEHRMYLSLAAPAVAAVIAAYLVIERLLQTLERSMPAKPRVPSLDGAQGSTAPPRLALAITTLLALCAASGLGAMTLQRNAQYRSEVSIWTDVTRSRPNNARAWTQLGVGRLEAGGREQAFGCFEQATRLDSHYADAWQNRSIAYGRAGRWDLALQDADEAVRLNPDSAPYWSNRGAVLAALGRDAEAVAACDRAIALDANDARTWYNRGNAHARLRQFDEAAEDYDKSIALAPDALAYQNRGNLRLLTGRNRQAVEDYNRAIALNPRLVNAYHNRAVAWSKLGSGDRALADERMFEKLGGRPNPDFIKTLTSAAQPRDPTQP